MQALTSLAAIQKTAQRQATDAHNARLLAFPENREPAAGAAAPVPTDQGRAEREAARAGRRGKHAAPPPPYLERRAARFILFCAIGGFVFVMGLFLQLLLTGKWHVEPMVSYVIQAVASVETSFLLNRWLTWRDRNVAFWVAFARFNAQKTVTIMLNVVLYAGLLRLGLNYLVANVALTVVFTVVNYVAGDRLVFIAGRKRLAEPATPPKPIPASERHAPSVSVVIPCRSNENTIEAAVQNLLQQDYCHIHEIILIGSPEDSTWSALGHVSDPRLSIWETETPPGMRDANFKRDAAVRMSTGELVALIDSDIVLPRDWMSRAVAALQDSGTSCVAGGMKSSHDSFWGRYTDSTWIGAKTPRIGDSYTVTKADYGKRGRKPPILANVLFTRELYADCPIDRFWSHGSYEDYEWFWRVVKAGYDIRVCQNLFGSHEHRRGMPALIKEYRRSSRGCAYFVRAHIDSPLAQRRLHQAVLLPLAAAIGIGVSLIAAVYGFTFIIAGLMLGCASLLIVQQVVRSRSLESAAYPAVGIVLGLVFTTGLITNLIRSGSPAASSAIANSPIAGRQARRATRTRAVPYALAGICIVQAALSLTLIRNIAAYSDEAKFLRVGRLVTASWLHGATSSSIPADRTVAGSPVLYPPLDALANNIGGLAGARLLSLGLTFIATTLLYLAASRLIDRTAGLFAAALWAIGEPTMRLASATSIPLSIFLMTLSAWLIIEAGYRYHRGEFIAMAVASLVLANMTAYSGMVVDPIVIAFAFLVWLPRMGKQQASFCTAWLTGGLIFFFCALMTFSNSWPGFLSSVVDSSMFGHQDMMLALQNTWKYSALIVSLTAIGVSLALGTENIQRAALLALLACAVVIVPVVQLHNQSIFSIDEHMSFGIWFAVIGAGYASSKFIRWLPDARNQLAVRRKAQG